MSVAAMRQRARTLALHAAVWGGIFLAVLLGYGFRAELRGAGERLLATVMPSLGYSSGETAVSYPVSSDGHYWVRGEANGVGFKFMVDTGATGIAFSRADAKRLGLDPATLRYDRPVSTANGLTHAAAISLQRLTIGPITVSNIAASINEGELEQPLLGMRFLERVGTIEIKDGVLTLRR